MPVQFKGPLIGTRIPDMIVDQLIVVEAKVVEHFDGGFKVFFSGSFCQTCGYYDYFEDLLYLLLDDFGVETEITDVTQDEDGDYVSFHLV